MCTDEPRSRQNDVGGALRRVGLIKPQYRIAGLVSCVVSARPSVKDYEYVTPGPAREEEAGPPTAPYRAAAARSGVGCVRVVAGPGVGIGRGPGDVFGNVVSMGA
jgi:hypothetical protein